MICGALHEKQPCTVTFKGLDPRWGTCLGSIRDGALLEEACSWGWTLRFQKPMPGPSPFIPVSLCLSLCLYLFPCIPLPAPYRVGKSSPDSSLKSFPSRIRNQNIFFPFIKYLLSIISSWKQKWNHIGVNTEFSQSLNYDKTHGTQKEPWLPVSQSLVLQGKDAERHVSQVWEHPSWPLQSLELFYTHGFLCQPYSNVVFSGSYRNQRQAGNISMNRIASWSLPGALRSPQGFKRLELSTCELSVDSRWPWSGQQDHHMKWNWRHCHS